MKKSLALVLALCMLLSLIPAMPAFAESRASLQQYSTDKKSGEVIIPVTETVGEWTESNSMLGYDGQKHIWANNYGDTAKYVIKDSKLKAGNYEVYIWVLPHKGNMEYMDYVLTHNGKETTVRTYQRLEEGEAIKPGWVSVGVYDFKADGSESLTSISESDGNIRANAIKLVPSKKELTPDTPVVKQPELAQPTPDKDTAGDGENSHKSNTLFKSVTVMPSGICTAVGDWHQSSISGPMLRAGGSYWIANSTGKDAYITYDPQLKAVGDIRIFAWLIHWKENQTTDVKYEVFHNGKVDEIHIDMTSITESDWYVLGTFDFAGTGDEYVKVSCTCTGEDGINTRGSTVAFEVLNSVNQNEVWQTVYVTPVFDNADKMQDIVKDMATLDTFNDMKDHWANYDVEFMANEGYVQGVAEGQFDPESTITRAEFVTILDRALDFEEVKEDVYTDVPSTEWFYGYVGAAAKNDLLKGLPIETEFLPNQPITREEMAVIIYNAIQKQNKNTEWVKDLPDTFNNFSDKDSVSAWATTQLQYLIQTGLIKGTSETTVSPLETATRAQATVILKRFMQMFVWAGAPADEEWVLTFSDEFLGDSLDRTKWKPQNQNPSHIQSARVEKNVEVRDGNLYLKNIQEEYAGKLWTSGGIAGSAEVFRQVGGYWEARYKISEGFGVNNSFWTMAMPGMYTESNQAFELDINEGHYPNQVCTNYHSAGVQHSETYTSEYDLSKDYHTYALEWNEDELLYYFDGELIATKQNENATIPLYPILATAILNWAGNPDENTDGSAMVVDYIRIYQRKADAENPEKTLHNQQVVPVKGTPTAGGTTAPADPDTPATPSTGIGGEVKKVTVAQQKTDNSTQKGEKIIRAEVDDKWNESGMVNYDYGKSLYSATEGAFSQYPLKKIAKGKYKVYFWRIPHKQNVDQMDLMIHQDGQDAYLGSAALRLADGESADCGWVLINDCLEVTGDKEAYIHYTCPGANCRATGIKLVPIK